jgi:predicted GNAT family acetyltransferase
LGAGGLVTSVVVPRVRTIRRFSNTVKRALLLVHTTSQYLPSAYRAHEMATVREVEAAALASGTSPGEVAQQLHGMASTFTVAVGLRSPATSASLAAQSQGRQTSPLHHVVHRENERRFIIEAVGGSASSPAFLEYSIEPATTCGSALSVVQLQAGQPGAAPHHSAGGLSGAAGAGSKTPESSGVAHGLGGGSAAVAAAAAERADALSKARPDHDAWATSEQLADVAANLNGCMLIRHVGVPEAVRGRGLGSALASEAFAWARAKGLAVRSSCSFVCEQFIPAHAERLGFVARQEGDSVVAYPRYTRV